MVKCFPTFLAFRLKFWKQKYLRPTYELQCKYGYSKTKDNSTKDWALAFSDLIWKGPT